MSDAWRIGATGLKANCQSLYLLRRVHVNFLTVADRLLETFIDWMIDSALDHLVAQFPDPHLLRNEQPIARP